MSNHCDWKDAELRRLRSELISDREGDPKNVVNNWKERVLNSSDTAEAFHFASVMEDIVSAIASPARKKLVLLVHGIRDRAVWMERIQDSLSGPGVSVQPLDYEDFNSPRFLSGLGTSDRRNFLWEKIRDCQSSFRDHDLYIIAHSFGTYLVSEILLGDPAIKCKGLILCGSVVSRRFEFRRMVDKPTIVNECGDRDIYPVLAEGFSLWNRYSASGVWGLRQTHVIDRFHDFEHSDYLVVSFSDQFWKPFIYDGTIVDSPHTKDRRDVPWGISVLAYGWRCVIPCATVLAVLVYLGVKWGAVSLFVAYVLFSLKIWGDVKKFHRPVHSSK